uniref:Histone H2A n=1 Tax=Steinernema glaseri TaxID=37863 RepID=A0A1I8ADX9_9BILA
MRWISLLLVLIAALLFLTDRSDAIGCMAQLCASNARSEPRGCPDKDGTCGKFKGKRYVSDSVMVNTLIRCDHSMPEAIDFECDEGSVIYAPFDGEMTYYMPYAGEKDKACADRGVRIEGTGVWQGYYTLIYSMIPDTFGGSVKAGDRIGVNGLSECILPDGQRGATPYVRMEVFKEGVAIDFLEQINNCHCIGQVCETNTRNSFIGAPMKSDERFNGVIGWELNCPMAPGDDSEDAARSPMVYSPISGSVIGRFRLTMSQKEQIYDGCDNDGVFIVGSGNWMDFEARIYNVRFREDISLGGGTNVEAGQHIANRLVCEDGTDSIFMEIRHKGIPVNVTNLLTGPRCGMPKPLVMSNEESAAHGFEEQVAQVEDQRDDYRSGHCNEQPHASGEDQVEEESKEQDASTPASKEKKARKKRVARSTRAGLFFPVGRVHRLLKTRRGGRVSSSAAIFATAILEYLTTEFLEQAGKFAMERWQPRCNIVRPRHLKLAIHGDDELNTLISATIAGGGVAPHIEEYLRKGSKTLAVIYLSKCKCFVVCYFIGVNTD